jgi:hypothetical protein
MSTSNPSEIVTFFPRIVFRFDMYDLPKMNAFAKLGRQHKLCGNDIRFARFGDVATRIQRSAAAWVEWTVWPWNSDGIFEANG